MILRNARHGLATTAALLAGLALHGCVVEGRKRLPDPQEQRDQDCAEQFIAPRIPSLQDVSYIYPKLLNPRDPQGRPIYTAMRQPGTPASGYCYVEAPIVPSVVPMPVAPPGPPGVQMPRTEVPCPPMMQDPRWWACPEGRVMSNAAHCPCVCYTSLPMRPPSLRPISCPAAGPAVAPAGPPGPPPGT